MFPFPWIIYFGCNCIPLPHINFLLIQYTNSPKNIHHMTFKRIGIFIQPNIYSPWRKECKGLPLNYYHPYLVLLLSCTRAYTKNKNFQSIVLHFGYGYRVCSSFWFHPKDDTQAQANLNVETLNYSQKLNKNESDRLTGN